MTSINQREITPAQGQLHFAFFDIMPARPALPVPTLQ
jgi:hypothetical protein